MGRGVSGSYWVWLFHFAHNTFEAQSTQNVKIIWYMKKVRSQKMRRNVRHLRLAQQVFGFNPTLEKNFLSTQRRKNFLSQGGFSPLLPAVTEAGFIGSLRCFRPGAVAFRLSYRPWYHGPLLGPGPKREREDSVKPSPAQSRSACPSPAQPLPIFQVLLV